MADQLTNSRSMLEGNSVLTNKQYDTNKHELLGFDIRNPDGSALHVDLSEYSRPQETPVSANKFREAVYENYRILVENVPAATAVFESTAREFPHGIVWRSPEQPGLWNKSSPGKGDNSEDPSSHPVIMVGNLKLPEGADPIQSGGGVSEGDARAQDYLGKDGRWHRHIPPEALLHEHVHATREMQNWLSLQAQFEFNMKIGTNIPMEHLKEVMRLENEDRAIEFVNQSMMLPVGVVERDPNAYRAVKPGNVNVSPRHEYSEEDKEKLRHGPIPPGLEAYSHPKVIPLEKSSRREDDHADGLASAQQAIVVARIHEHVSNSLGRGDGLSNYQLEHEFSER